MGVDLFFFFLISMMGVDLLLVDGKVTMVTWFSFIYTYTC